MSTQIHSGLHAQGGKVHIYVTTGEHIYSHDCVCGGGGNNVNAHLRRTVRQIDAYAPTCKTCAAALERFMANAPEQIAPALKERINH